MFQLELSLITLPMPVIFMASFSCNAIQYNISLATHNEIQMNIMHCFPPLQKHQTTLNRY